MNRWTNHTPRDCPNQENGYDCGVFTCIFEEHLSRGAVMAFNQGRMTYSRMRIANEIESVSLKVVPKSE
jgi:sentrin-specific protease 1